MTPTRFEKAFQAGFDRLAAWSDLLDAINVFPVADGDTGRNLQVSLAPLKTYHAKTHVDRLATQLLRSARGNSGNIATQFFSEFIDTPATPMDKAAAKGARAAYQAVQTPLDGTILTVFDTLAVQLANRTLTDDASDVSDLLGNLRTTVQNSRETLPRLRAAGVVDAGALGMYLFFEGFFLALVDQLDDCRPPSDSFPEGLDINAAFREQENQGYCVDTVLRAGPDMDTVIRGLGTETESVVTIARGDIIKLHFHTTDRETTRRALEATGALVRWSEDDLTHQVKTFNRRAPESAVHIVTDGAASLTRADRSNTDSPSWTVISPPATGHSPKPGWPPRISTAACVPANRFPPPRPRYSNATSTTSASCKPTPKRYICASDRPLPATIRRRWPGNPARPAKPFENHRHRRRLRTTGGRGVGRGPSGLPGGRPEYGTGPGPNGL